MELNYDMFYLNIIYYIYNASSWYSCYLTNKQKNPFYIIAGDLYTFC
jgi:hypothetical protein